MIYTLLSFSKFSQVFLYETTYLSLEECLLRIEELQKTKDNEWIVYPNLYNPYGEREHEIVCCSDGIVSQYRIVVKNLSK